MSNLNLIKLNVIFSVPTLKLWIQDDKLVDLMTLRQIIFYNHLNAKFVFI